MGKVTYRKYLMNNLSFGDENFNVYVFTEGCNNKKAPLNIYIRLNDQFHNVHQTTLEYHIFYYTIIIIQYA